MGKLAHIDCYLFDLDGTVYLDGTPIPGVLDAIDTLRKNGKQICFVTNNSSVSAKTYHKKLNGIGLPATLDEVYTSGLATIDCLKTQYAGAKVLLLGTPDLQEEFSEHGIALTKEHPDVCVIGYDKTLTYDKIVLFDYWLKQGLPYIATHPDKTCPHPGAYMPDTGAFIELFFASAGRRPDIICGKPYAPLSVSVAKRCGAQLSRMAMTGDRLYTDVLFAQNNGMTGILVLSGETTEESLRVSGIQPDLVLSSAAQIPEYL